MTYELIDPNEPILQEVLPDITFEELKEKFGLEPKELFDNLGEAMTKYKGIGLSANQIGINERAFVMIRDLEYNEIMTCFNPKIVKQSPKSVIMEEGCLSFPDVLLDVKRSESIVVKYEDENKQTHKVKLDGFAARVFLHEFDHMQGITFTERT